jgi:hypothetical protein
MQTKVRLEAISMAELLKLDSVGFIDTAGIDPQAGSTLSTPNEDFVLRRRWGTRARARPNATWVE